MSTMFAETKPASPKLPELVGRTECGGFDFPRSWPSDALSAVGLIRALSARMSRATARAMHVVSPIACLLDSTAVLSETHKGKLNKTIFIDWDPDARVA
jgi:hypothetical protein